MKSIKIRYAVINNNYKTFLMIVPKNITAKSMLEKISFQQSTRYNHLYYNNAEINKDDIIYEHKINDDILFVASTENTPPPKQFFVNFYKPKKKFFPIVNHNAKVVEKKPIDPVVPKVPSKVPSNIKNEPKFTFYFTGGSKEFLHEGIKIDLDLKMTPSQTKEYLESQLSTIIDMKDKQLIIYLSGCFPFHAETLEDVYLSKDAKFSRVIYGVVTRKIPDSILNRSYPELCNIKGSDRELLLSPLCDSSEIGLSDVACILGYLNHDGNRSDDFLHACAFSICFPPMITSLYKIIHRDSVVGKDIVVVTSTLFTFIRSGLEKIKIKDKNVFDYALRMCCILSRINKNEGLPIQPILVKYYKSLSLFSKVDSDLVIYLWKADMGEKFNNFCLKIKGDEEELLSAYYDYSYFKPISPLSIHFVTGTSIVKGKNHQYLYLSQSQSKKAEDQNKADIINPLTGLTETVDIEKFAKEQKDEKVDNFQALIDPDKIEQIIMVVFDVSNKMKYSIKSGELSLFATAYQYAMNFASNIYNYHIPSIQGLISFSSQINYLCPLSPYFSDFIENGLNKLQPPSELPHLWDSLDEAIEKIIRFRKSFIGKEKFKNAVSRILVISGGEDNKSSSMAIDIASKLVKNKIVVDSIVFDGFPCEELSVITHITNGFCIKQTNASDILSLIGQEAFLDYKKRHLLVRPVVKDERRSTPNKIASYPKIITSDFMYEACKNAFYDTQIPNKVFLAVNTNTKLATPAHICSKNQHNKDSNHRYRRILRELHLAAEMLEPKSDLYDPEIKIVTLSTCLDIWKVFIKGPENTPYENKWWFIYVTFPENYPVSPPIIKFSSIPYNLNVSFDGKICFHSLEKDYMPTKRVIDILQEIKEIFLLQNPEYAVEIEILDVFMNNRDEYERLARKSALENAKDDFTNYLSGRIAIEDSVDEDFKLNFEEHVPNYMISQISGREIKDPVLSSTNIWYDREELKQLITSSQNPICVVTGKVLTDKLEDLDSI